MAMRFFIALISIMIFLAASICMPFAGIASEAFIVLLAIGALIALLMFLGPLAARMKPVAQSVGDIVRNFATFVLAVMLTGSIIAPLLERIRYARHLSWQCDGRVLEKTRSSNHNLPMLIVQDDAGGKITLEGLDPDFWTAAKDGDRVQKRAGECDALLNGQRHKIVRGRWRSRTYPEERDYSTGSQ